jgi:hypothetical protein
MALSQRKGARSVVAGLAFLVIVLAGSSGLLYYQNQNYASSHSRTDAEYNSYVASHSYNNTQYNSLNAIYNTYVITHSHSNDEYDVLNHTSPLEDYQRLLYDDWSDQTPNGYTSWNFSLLYPGYVWVNIPHANRTNIYIEVSYTADIYPHDPHRIFTFNQRVDFTDWYGWAVFPVLPCTDFQIRLGNTNQVGGTSMSVRANYYF